MTCIPRVIPRVHDPHDNFDAFGSTVTIFYILMNIKKLNSALLLVTNYEPSTKY